MSIVPVVPPAKIAPKIKIRMTGKIKPKNNPNLFLRYPRLKTLKSAKIRFPLDMLHALHVTVVLMFVHDFAVFADFSADKLNEDIVQTVSAGLYFSPLHF